MASDLTQQVDAVDLPGLLAELYPASGAKAGRGGAVKAIWRGETNASCYLFKHGQAWLLKDHGTDQVWNALQFLTDVEGMSHEEACDKLGFDHEQPVHYTRVKGMKETMKPLEEVSIPGDFTPPASLSGRGFLPSDIQRYGIKNDNGDALIPITGVDGEVYNVKRRLLNADKHRYKYEYTGIGAPVWFSPGFLDSNAQLWVEGELNALIAHSVLREHGTDIGVAGIPGASANLPDISLAGRTVYLYADKDKAGNELRERFGPWAIEQGAKSVAYLEAQDEDFCEIAGKPMGRALLYSHLNDAWQVDPVLTILDKEVHDDYKLGELREIGRAYINGELLRPMGYSELDAYTGGLPLTGIIEVAALPSFGKSIMVRDINLFQVQNNNERVLHFTPDQSIPETAMFLASKLSGISASLLRTGLYPKRLLEEHGSPEAIRKAWGEVYDHCLLRLSKNYRMSESGHMRHIRKRIEKALDEGFTFFSFDYGQILKYYDDRGREVEDRAIGELKMMTRDYKIPILLALQLAKYKFPVGSKRSPLPHSSDIQGTGEYYQAAEQLYMIWDYELYEREYGGEETPYPTGIETDTGKVRIYVRKNKSGPWGQWRYLRKNHELGTFQNMTEGVDR